MRFDVSPFSFAFYLSLAAASLTRLVASAASSATPDLSKRASCQRFSTTFSSASDVSTTPAKAAFLPISPEGSYAITEDGLRLDLNRPDGTIVRTQNTNNLLGNGATVNSTFLFRYGVASFQIKAPAVSGAIVAAILIADNGDEIDMEIICGISNQWTTNIFAPQKEDKGILYGVFGGTEYFVHKNDTVADLHTYTIDWNADRIIWSVDGKAQRTLTPAQTVVNGVQHYPTGLSRISMGIWDASSPVGTSNWGRGPIDWDKAPSPISAFVRSVSVDCPS